MLLRYTLILTILFGLSL